MIKLVSRFKELPDRKRNIILCIIGAIALLIIVVSELFTGEDIPSPQENRSEYAEDYIERTEKELCSILEDIDGAGRVEVMITLESCYENVYAKGHSTQKDVDDSGEQSQLTEEYVIVKNGSGTVIIKQQQILMPIWI